MAEAVSKLSLSGVWASYFSLSLLLVGIFTVPQASVEIPH